MNPRRDVGSGRLRFARTLVSRRQILSKLEYLLHVAMPAIRTNLTGIAVEAGEAEQRGILVADVETSNRNAKISGEGHSPAHGGVLC